ncbi:MAG: hypothetical protein NTX80_00135 [Candidatus Saccharibacteria bacterium]|jgi:hypothetical protein|nr:hypothetical protein [Candidatus Saccharibacteria bacterium]
MNQTINKQISVLSYYFSSGNCARFFPKKIEFEGSELDLIESGLRCLVKKGQSFIQIFNMSDGNNEYRLSFEPDNREWTLLSMKAQA